MHATVGISKSAINDVNFKSSKQKFSNLKGCKKISISIVHTNVFICNISCKNCELQECIHGLSFSTGHKRYKQEGAELCQAQPANHKLFGSSGAIFFLFELLMVVLSNC